MDHKERILLIRRLSLREALRVKMRLLNQGWDIVQELNGGGRFIMKRRA
jgi:hypothetical protein